MHLRSVIWAAAFAASVCALAAASEPPTAIDFDHIEHDAIVFKMGGQLHRLSTHLTDLGYLGALQTPETDPGLPYFLFTGTPCEGRSCIEDRKIYAIRPDGTRPLGFVYPGKVLDSKSHVILMQSRAFYGRCLSRHGDVYVVFQEERVPTHHGRSHRILKSVYLAEPGPQHMNEKLIERGFPRLIDTLRRVRHKQCHEVDGRNRVLVQGPLDLRRHPGQGPGDDGDDDDDRNDDSSGGSGGDPATALPQPAPNSG